MYNRHQTTVVVILAELTLSSKWIPLMPAPDGKLTPSQYEIMNIVWDRGSDGATVAEIWESISNSREVARTTVLNLVDRLRERGWLKRRKRGGTFRYVATVNREKTSGLLAADFVDDFFGGSAAELVMSLLGSRRIDPREIERLRKLLDAPSDDGS